jgi:hypothetical protein
MFAFVADTNPNKRDLVIDKLVWTYEFADKWTMFFGDLFKNNATATNVTRYQQGRDAFHQYSYNSILQNKPYDQMVREMITGVGDNCVNGATTGWSERRSPWAQDTYDGGGERSADVPWY